MSSSGWAWASWPRWPSTRRATGPAHARQRPPVRRERHPHRGAPRPLTCAASPIASSSCARPELTETVADAVGARQAERAKRRQGRCQAEPAPAGSQSAKAPSVAQVGLVDAIAKHATRRPRATARLTLHRRTTACLQRCPPPPLPRVARRNHAHQQQRAAVGVDQLEVEATVGLAVTV